MKSTRLQKPSAFKPELQLQLPSSKSISNRLLIMHALSAFRSSLQGLSDASDTIILQRILQENPMEVNVEDAGTAMRFLLAYFALKGEERILRGTERMQQRPLAPLIQALRQLGADIQCLEREGFAPLHIRPASLQGGTVQLDAALSSQFCSALMMIAPCLPGGLRIELQGEKAVSWPYITMTASLMRSFGVLVETNQSYVSVPGGQSYVPGSFLVEADWSAASYWYLIAALLPGCNIRLQNLSLQSVQGDAVLAQIARVFGLQSKQEEQDVSVFSSPVDTEMKEPWQFDFSHYPDLVPAIATLCAARGIQAEFTGVAHLEFKESKRLQALQAELNKFGPVVGLSTDTLIINGKAWQCQADAKLDTYNDHRMAMAFAPLALRCGSVIIHNPDVVRKSYPAFWSHLQKAGFDLQELNG